MKKNIILAGIFILVVIIAVVLYFKVILPQVPPYWDEATDTFHRLQIAQALQQKEFRAFWQATINQSNYPFLNTWIYGGLMALFGQLNLIFPRVISLGFFVASSILLYLIGRKISLQKLGGIFATLFYLSSPMILYFASSGLLESIMLFWMLFTILLFFKALETEKIGFYFLTGLILGLGILTKFNSGFYPYFGLTIFALSHLILKPKDFLSPKTYLKYLALFLPGPLLLFWWLRISPVESWESFCAVVRSNIPYPYHPTFYQSLAYFPKAILASYSAGWSVYLILVVSFFISLTRLKDPKIRVLMFIFLINFFPAVLHRINQQERYIFTVVPLLFLMADSILNLLLPKLKTSLVLKIGMILIGVLFVWDVVNVPRYIRPTASHTIHAALYNEIDYQDTQYDFNRKYWPKNLSTNKESSWNVLDFVAKNVDLTKPIEIHGQVNELSPNLFLSLPYIYLNQNLKPEITRNIIALEVKSGGRYDTYDFQFATNSLQKEVKEINQDWQKNELNKESENNFSHLGLKVTIYSESKK